MSHKCRGLDGGRFYEKFMDLKTRLFRHIFNFYNGRFPEMWELTLGLALVTGMLTVQRLPAARALWPVHEAAVTVRAALNF